MRGVIFIHISAADETLFNEPIKSTKRDLFPAWWHILALSHPQAHTDRVTWADGFGGFCVLETKFYKLQLSSADQPSREQAGHKLCSKPFFMWTA